MSTTASVRAQRRAGTTTSVRAQRRSSFDYTKRGAHLRAERLEQAAKRGRYRTLRRRRKCTRCRQPFAPVKGGGIRRHMRTRLDGTRVRCE